MPPKLKYSPEQIDALIDGIYHGQINELHLPRQLYKATTEVFDKAIKEIFDGEFPELLKDLRDNMYLFSGAKTFTQVQTLRSLTDGATYEDFKAKAKATFNTFNKAYLETEYVTAVTAAGSAKSWAYANENKKTFPRLRCVVILDIHTTDVCKRCKDITLPLGDKFWNYNKSPRHFNCRCHEELIDAYDDIENTTQAALSPIAEQNEKEMNPVFKMNPGKRREIFASTGDAQHPYFDVPKKYAKLAQRNFNLPIP